VVVVVVVVVVVGVVGSFAQLPAHHRSPHHLHRATSPAPERQQRPHHRPHRHRSTLASTLTLILTFLYSGVCEGASISMFYDPMIAKLCSHAPTRLGAIAAMEHALDQYFISGLVNNIPFLRSVYRNEKSVQFDFVVVVVVVVVVVDFVVVVVVVLLVHDN
jgi:biotin carboxylase